MNQSPISKDKLAALDDYIESIEDKQGSLITVLHHAQSLFGYLPDDVQLHVARKLNIPAAKVYGVVSFYSFFTTSPKGRNKISICMGTACFVRKAGKVLAEMENHLNIKSGQVTEDGLFSIDSLRCVGACGLAPVVMVGDKVYGRVRVEDVQSIIEECKKEALCNE